MPCRTCESCGRLVCEPPEGLYCIFNYQCNRCGYGEDCRGCNYFTPKEEPRCDHEFVESPPTYMFLCGLCGHERVVDSSG